MVKNSATLYGQLHPLGHICVMLSVTSLGTIVFSSLAASQVELHRERVKEANAAILVIAGAFALMILFIGYMWWCECDAKRRVEAWARQEGFELVEFRCAWVSRELFFLYATGPIKVRDKNGVMRTGSFSGAGGILATLFRKVTVKWQ